MLTEGMQAMEEYCSGAGCRRALLLRHFREALPGGAAHNCGACDNCLRGPAAQSRDLSADARLLLAAVKQTGGKFGSGMPVNVLRGSGNKARHICLSPRLPSVTFPSPRRPPPGRLAHSHSNVRFAGREGARVRHQLHVLRPREAPHR